MTRSGLWRFLHVSEYLCFDAGFCERCLAGEIPTCHHRLGENATMTWTGGCLCGAVRYEAKSEPIVCHCHCGRCRRSSGAAFVTWLNFPHEGFRWTKNEPAYFASSAQVRRGFCAQCGSSVSFHRAQHVSVSLGSLDRPGDVEPTVHIWCERQLPWLVVNDGLPQEARFGPGYEHLLDPALQE